MKRSLSFIILIIAFIFGVYNAAFASEEVGFIIKAEGKAKILRETSVFEAKNDFKLESSDTIETGEKSKIVMFLNDENRGGIKTLGSSQKKSVSQLLAEKDYNNLSITDITGRMLKIVLDNPQNSEGVMGTRSITTTNDYLMYKNTVKLKIRIRKQCFILYPRGIIMGPLRKVVWRKVDEATGYDLSVISKNNETVTKIKNFQTDNYFIDLSKEELGDSGNVVLVLKILRNAEVLATEEVKISMLPVNRREEISNKINTISGRLSTEDKELEAFYSGSCFMENKMYSEAFKEFMRFAKVSNCRKLSERLILAALYGSGYRDRSSEIGISSETITDIFKDYLDIFGVRE